jgi:hypothetical protein
MLSLEEHLHLEALLLQRLKEHKPELEEMLAILSGHWTYEDHFYRYYHGSWKVYGTQNTTAKAVNLLRTLLPEREFNLMFEDILKPRFLTFVPTDPFEGGPLRYRRLSKGYVLYSVDRDGHDDGGREKPERRKSSDQTSYDITFTVER